MSALKTSTLAPPVSRSPSTASATPSAKRASFRDDTTTLSYNTMTDVVTSTRDSIPHPGTLRTSTLPRKFVNQAEELRIFRHGVGIPIECPDLESNIRERYCGGWLPFYKRARWNMRPPADGLYGKLLREEQGIKVKYHVCAWVTNSSLLLQIIIGALLTAFGASDKTGLVIAALAAFNTVIAGLLALMKGHGLPNRFLQDLIALRKVRDFIEHRECDFEQYGQGWTGGDAKRAVRKARQMYYIARKTIDDNKNEMYVLSTGNDKDENEDEDPQVKQLEEYSSPVTPAAPKADLSKNTTPQNSESKSDS